MFPLLLFVLGTLVAQAAGEKEVTTAVQRLFDAMSARDTAGVRAAFLPGATLLAMRPNATAGSPAGAEDFATRIGASKEALLERMWSPRVLIHGAVAVLWAPYDFHRDGKFSHCGVDSVSLGLAGGVWKIASIAYTVEMENCPVSPLGPVPSK